MRRAGTKNRATLVRELKELGSRVRKPEVLSREALQQKVDKLKAKLPPPPKAKPVVDRDVAKAIVEDGRARLRVMAQYYSPEKEVEIPDRVDDCLCRAFLQPDRNAAVECMAKALQKMHVHLLAEWMKNRISGPYTEENIAKLAAKQQDWAERLSEKYMKGDDDVTMEDIERQQAKVAATRRIKPVSSGAAPWAWR